MKAKRVLALLLAMLMAVSLLSACTKQEASQNESAAEAEDGEITVEPLTLPLTAEKKELTVWLLYSGSVMSDLNEIEGIKKTADFIMKMDKKRSAYYNYYTNEEWGSASNYDLCLNSSKFGVDGCVDIILDVAARIKKD